MTSSAKISRAKTAGRTATWRRAGALLGVVAAACQLVGWTHWGGDAGGSRYAEPGQITPDNVERLIKAWDYRTGDVARRPAALMARTKFEATPILADGNLVFCTAFNEVIALDPGTGRQKWRYDPQLSETLRPANRYVCRGVAHWLDAAIPDGAACRSRILTGTNDARLIALDATTGAPCENFGDHGQVKIAIGKDLLWPGEFQITSAPVVARGVVIVGSSIADNVRVDAPLGAVRAFDARTGAPRWSFDPLEHNSIEAGHANVWAPMSIDEARGLVFLPTSSPSPDFWGGKRPGNNAHSDSVVALKIDSGELAWSFQTVHHDVWDYDLPAQPTLARIDAGQGPRDVVIQPTKQGFVFVLDRDSGQPVWPVEERAVPQGAAEGDTLSPTQPYPTHLPPLTRQSISTDDMLSLLGGFGAESCRSRLAAARNDGLYTPPSTQGTIEFPMTGGGVNWGSAAFDPVRQILYANTSAAVHLIELMPRPAAQDYKPPPGQDFGPQFEAPFAMTRSLLTSPIGGLLCNKPPWGTMVALDVKAGKILWRSVVGTSEDKAPLGIALPWGTPLVNGPIVTAGGVIFTGAMDAYLRAFDASDGRELWQGRLPVPGVADPMTYVWGGEQYVVIAAGGHSEAGTSIGDSVVAFRLARSGEAPSLWSRTIDRPGGRFMAKLGIFAAILLLAATAVVARRRRKRRPA